MKAFLIVDDHEVLRTGMAHMLKALFPGVFIGEAGEAQEALRLLEARTWDLMILDIGLPGRSGLEVLQDVHRIRPALPVLVLTGLTDDAVAIRVFESGAMGYLSKSCSEGDLATAVRKLLEGGRYLTASLAEKLVMNLNKGSSRNAPGDTHGINGRMLDVMLRLGQGDTVKAIAADMNLSVKTISTYRSRVLERLHLKSNADIVRYCLTQGLA